MSMMSELAESEILFHTVDSKLYHELPEDSKFGILRVKVAAPDQNISKKMAIMFTLDCSASMSDYCTDNRKKLDHAKHTMIGIITYLADVYNTHPLLDISVALLTFSSTTRSIFDFTRITPENLGEYVEKISRIHTEQTTNIGLALQEADRLLREFRGREPTTVIHHVQLTDGEVSDGEMNHDKLVAMVSPDYNHVFVGFGKEHDDLLLCRLSENLRNDYRFIDKMEFSSIVYGEILYNILFCKYDRLRIEIKGGEIYDWYTNSWQPNIYVANIPYDCERVYQVRSLAKVSITDIEVQISEDGADVSTAPVVIYCLPDLIDIETGERDLHDLTKYSFRQKTQELLFEVREYIKKYTEEQTNHQSQHILPSQLVLDTDSEEDGDTYDDRLLARKRDRIARKCLYKKCQEFMRTMKEYMVENDLENDYSLRLLQDDVLIILKTIYRRNAHLWCTTRQRSLGQDHSYHPTQVVDVENLPASWIGNSPPPPPRGNRLRPSLFQNRTNNKVYYTTKDPPIYTFALFDHPMEDEDIIPEHPMVPTPSSTATTMDFCDGFNFNMMSPSLARTIHGVSQYDYVEDVDSSIEEQR